MPFVGAVERQAMVDNLLSRKRSQCSVIILRFNGLCSRTFFLICALICCLSHSPDDASPVAIKNSWSLSSEKQHFVSWISPPVQAKLSHSDCAYFKTTDLTEFMHFSILFLFSYTDHEISKKNVQYINFPLQVFVLLSNFKHISRSHVRKWRGFRFACFKGTLATCP